MNRLCWSVCLLLISLALPACPDKQVPPDGEIVLDASPQDEEPFALDGQEPDSWPLRTYSTYQTIPAHAQLPVAPSVDQVVPLPASLSTYTSPHFTGATVCADCHNDLKDRKGADVSIVSQWSSTMMANAARDPYWLAQVEHEVQLQPSLQATIESKCARCHMPMAHVEATKAKEPTLMSGEGFLNPSHPYHRLAMDGVSCTLCHQIKQTPEMGTLAGVSGKFVIESFAQAGDRKIYGPYKDPLLEPMRSNANYTPTGTDHLADSKFCASCHMLKTPFVDAAGKVIPKDESAYFPEQMAYEEWKRSSFSRLSAGGRSCQSCHMTLSEGVAISFGPPWIQTRDYFRQHAFVGGNRFMLEIMNENKDLLGVRGDQFGLTIARTKEMLASAAVLSVTDKQFFGGRLRFRVKIASRTGHKLPTGYPARRVFLHVIVKNEAQEIVFESGKTLANGHIIGVDADLDGTRYEPHYDTITSPDQVQVYESIMADNTGKVTTSVMRAARYLKDNRILPLGFAKEGAPKDIQVAGAASKDPNFGPGADTVTYDIAGLPRSRYHVAIALMYQSISYRMALDLAQGKRGPAVQRFLYLYRKSRQFTDTIATISFSH